MHIHSTRLSIVPASPFDFRATVYSHGWVVLAPNVWEKERCALKRVERLPTGKIVWLDISGAESFEQPEITIQVRHRDDLSPEDQRAVTAAVEHMFRVDEDFSEFYALCDEFGGRWTELTAGLGRLLRSPTFFEDVVKTICTTNIQWGGTMRMVRELVDGFGEPYPGEPTLCAFPTPEALAAASPEVFRETVRLGYRSEYVHTLARRVASGDLDLEALHDPNIPTPELKKRLLAIKGVGNYAAATLLMLLGRYDELAVDTGFRSFVSQKYFEGQRTSDAEAKAVYAEWGRWQYLAYWFDLWQEYVKN